MNGWETKFSDELEIQKRAGFIKWYGFEAIRLRLAGGCTYCPDFAIELVSGKMRFVEIKGHIRTASMIRFKVAVEQHPWAEFQMIRKASNANGGGWERIK
jgi:hypothetical protein